MDTAGGGHLYVVHGLIESLDVDATIVPTDGAFAVQPYWYPVTGDPGRARPPGWPGIGFAPSNTDPGVWFISVFSGRRASGYGLGDRVRQVITAIVSSGLKAAESRPVPRIAIPVLGIGRGGMSARRGAALDGLLTALWDSVRDNAVDVVLVTPDAAVFSAAQHRRRSSADTGTGSFAWELADRDLVEARRLGGLARDGHLALFLGAGVSVAAGLPSWNDLLAQLAERTRQDAGLVKELGALDAAELLTKDVTEGQIGRWVCEIVGATTKISLAHGLLAGLNSREAITTNYDALFERAVTQAGRRAPTVLPWEPVEVGRPWLLKLHGDVERPDSVVLTRRDFVLFDARSRPAGSLLQATLMTKHLLLVGASLADDNVIRLAMEVDDYLSRNQAQAPQGTFIDVSGHEARQRLWSNQFHWFICQGDELSDRVRQMEIFLDVVAAYATSDASWLLDERFSGLLDDGERRIVDVVRSALAQVPDGEGGLLAPLRRVREQLGGAPG